MAIFVNESRHNIDILITNCTFEKNIARSFGGGVYLLLGGFGTHHRVVVERATVVSNVARQGGGGFQASFFNNGPEEDPLLMKFDDCHFENNSAIGGGGIFVFTSTDGMFMYLCIVYFCAHLSPSELYLWCVFSLWDIQPTFNR